MQKIILTKFLTFLNIIEKRQELKWIRYTNICREHGFNSDSKESEETSKSLNFNMIRTLNVQYKEWWIGRGCDKATKRCWICLNDAKKPWYYARAPNFEFTMSTHEILITWKAERNFKWIQRMKNDYCGGNYNYSEGIFIDIQQWRRKGFMD